MTHQLRGHFRNTEAWDKALSLFPGGVNSPVRAFRRVGGTPLTFATGKGPWLQDLDGWRYLDFNQSWGSLIHGHAHGPTLRAISARAARGTSFGAPTPDEVRLGAMVRDHIPSMERLRFVSSGTEAVMSALRVARAATGRSLVLKFDGCYHGHSDQLLVAAGSGVAEIATPPGHGRTGGSPAETDAGAPCTTTASSRTGTSRSSTHSRSAPSVRADSAGVDPAVAALTLSVPYNDLAAASTAMAARGRDVAAIIVEPVAANMGLVLPLPGFLEGLRTLADQYGALLILDEVITGFRVHRGGAQGLWKLRPDLTTIGKIVGGGLPAAAFGGRRDLMELLAPLGPVYQAGTLSGNPLAMAAGAAALAAMDRPGVRAALDRRATDFSAGLREALAPLGGAVNSVASMVGISFRPAGEAPGPDGFPCPPHAWTDVARADQDAFATFFHRALALGIYLSPSPFETHFVSTAHTDRHLDRAIRAARTIVAG